MYSALRHIHSRRTELARNIDVIAAFEQWEESCVPSYCHRNLLAAYVSWWRLFRAFDLAREHRPHGRASLDFGSSVGELGHLLKGTGCRYDFIEANEQAVTLLQNRLPQAFRRNLEDLPPATYDWVFAIDSLEHNDDYRSLLKRLASALAPNGIMIISGPTENWLYRFGRRIAGFDGHYHTTTIFEIERAAQSVLRHLDTVSILPGLPLFRLSVWTTEFAT
jgi:2-polyprenyl-3-methyl-5-hydroxy-6-metoxy-1,4-benzoquinol methylase